MMMASVVSTQDYDEGIIMGSPSQVYFDHCLVCNKICYYQGAEEDKVGGSRDVDGDNNYCVSFVKEVRQLFYETFHIPVGKEVLSSLKQQELPLCPSCVLKLGRLQILSEQLSRIEGEFKRLKESVAFKIVDVVASHGSTSATAASQSHGWRNVSEENIRSCLIEDEVDTLQQIIFCDWHDKHPLPPSPPPPVSSHPQPPSSSMTVPETEINNDNDKNISSSATYPVKKSAKQERKSPSPKPKILATNPKPMISSRTRSTESKSITTTTTHNKKPSAMNTSLLTRKSFPSLYPQKIGNKKPQFIPKRPVLPPPPLLMKTKSSSSSASSFLRKIGIPSKFPKLQQNPTRNPPRTTVISITTPSKKIKPQPVKRKLSSGSDKSITNFGNGNRNGDGERIDIVFGDEHETRMEDDPKKRRNSNEGSSESNEEDYAGSHNYADDSIYRLGEDIGLGEFMVDPSEGNNFDDEFSEEAPIMKENDEGNDVQDDGNDNDTSNESEMDQDPQSESKANSFSSTVIDPKYVETLIAQLQQGESPPSSSGVAAGNLEFHQNEEGLYVCMFCSKTFIHKYPYRDHLKTHTGEGPKCPICGKIFPKNHNLMLHLRTHTGEKPYKCDVCGKGFADKSNLKVHYRVHTGERPYRCEFCDQAFVNSSRLVVHRRLHTGEKPFACNICAKPFTTANQLAVHRKVHGTTTSTAAAGYDDQEDDMLDTEGSSTFLSGWLNND